MRKTGGRCRRSDFGRLATMLFGSVSHRFSCRISPARVICHQRMIFCPRCIDQASTGVTDRFVPGSRPSACVLVVSSCTLLARPASLTVFNDDATRDVKLCGNGQFMRLLSSANWKATLNVALGRFWTVAHRAHPSRTPGKPAPPVSLPTRVGTVWSITHP